MNGQTRDWEFLELMLSFLGVSVTRDIFSLGNKASLSAADSMATEALLYTSDANLERFKLRLHEGLSGPLEFAGLYAGISAKYAYFCSLGKPKIVLQHFATQSWEPLFPDPAEPISSECWSEGLDIAKKAWAITQEEPKILTYGATG